MPAQQSKRLQQTQAQVDEVRPGVPLFRRVKPGFTSKPRASRHVSAQAPQSDLRRKGLL